jgi:hypothetical protein
VGKQPTWKLTFRNHEPRNLILAAHENQSQYDQKYDTLQIPDRVLIGNGLLYSMVYSIIDLLSNWRAIPTTSMCLFKFALRMFYQWPMASIHKHTRSLTRRSKWMDVPLLLHIAIHSSLIGYIISIPQTILNLKPTLRITDYIWRLQMYIIGMYKVQFHQRFKISSISL